MLSCNWAQIGWLTSIVNLFKAAPSFGQNGELNGTTKHYVRVTVAYGHDITFQVSNRFDWLIYVSVNSS